MDFDIIIVGGGPSGLTAGIYASRAKAKVLIVNEGSIGGQMVLTHQIDNYPGVESVSGYQLSKTMRQQAKIFGCTVKTGVTLTNISLDGEVKSVELDEKQTFTAKSIIIATGGRSRNLNVKGEDEFKGKGISYCATCDGDFYRDMEIIVVGGGNSALEEAVSLTKYASKVTIVHQFDHFQGYQHAIDEAKAHSKINFMLESRIIEFIGTEKLEKVRIESLNSGEITEMSISGVFIFIGYVPQTEFLKDKLELNSWGEIVVDNNLQTNQKGVFAAGDARVTRTRQITTAVADGTVAALRALDYINQK
jgi:thioredoxin reductase (NADPH)